MSKRMRSGRGADAEERSAKRRTSLGKEKARPRREQCGEGGVRPTPTEAGFYAESREAAAMKCATSQPLDPFASDAVVQGTGESAGAGSMVRSAASAAESASAGTLSTLFSHVSKTASTW